MVNGRRPHCFRLRGGALAATVVTVLGLSGVYRVVSSAQVKPPPPPPLPPPPPSTTSVACVAIDGTYVDRETHAVAAMTCATEMASGRLCSGAKRTAIDGTVAIEAIAVAATAPTCGFANRLVWAAEPCTDEFGLTGHLAVESGRTVHCLSAPGELAFVACCQDVAAGLDGAAAAAPKIALRHLRRYKVPQAAPTRKVRLHHYAVNPGDENDPVLNPDMAAAEAFDDSEERAAEEVRRAARREALRIANEWPHPDASIRNSFSEAQSDRLSTENELLNIETFLAEQGLAGGDR